MSCSSDRLAAGSEAASARISSGRIWRKGVLASAIAAHCGEGGITIAATHQPLGLTRAVRITLGEQH